MDTFPRGSIERLNASPGKEHGSLLMPSPLPTSRMSGDSKRPTILESKATEVQKPFHQLQLQLALRYPATP
jgi:hypothetical protein